YYYAVATNMCGADTTNNTSGKHIVGPTCTPSTVATGCATSGADVRVASAGTVTYGASGGAITANTTIINNNGITQEWSDNVRASNCASRSTWTGVTNSMSDCRNATNNFSGHYFTWCFVNRYATTLCPSGFRVPTCQDFIDLDIALGGTGHPRWTGGTGDNDPASVPSSDKTIEAQVEWYLGASGDGNTAVNNGGTWGGSRFSALASNLTGASSNYWSSSQSSGTTAFRLYLLASRVNPQSEANKLNGFALRCVR
ncbi:MAG: hypothetical protein FWG79_06510, partial [Bacteroidales bacterium]|nr:hypothetical protein [Bacteroidales bacterium]